MHPTLAQLFSINSYKLRATAAPSRAVINRTVLPSRRAGEATARDYNSFSQRRRGSSPEQKTYVHHAKHHSNLALTHFVCGTRACWKGRFASPDAHPIFRYATITCILMYADKKHPIGCVCVTVRVQSGNATSAHRSVAVSYCGEGGCTTAAVLSLAQ